MPKLKENEIVEKWSVLIEGAQGRQKEFYQMVEDRLKELEPPKLEVSQKKIYPSLLRRLQGDSKLFLLITNKYFDGYIVHAGAENYGNQLNISWYLTQRPSKFGELIVKLPWFISIFLVPFYWLYSFLNRISRRSVSLENMDIFDLNELGAFAGTVHHAVVYGSNLIASSVGFDFSKVDTKSRGFLNIT